MRKAAADARGGVSRKREKKQQSKLSKREKGALAKVKRALDPEADLDDDEREKVYGVVDLGAINKSLEEEVNKIHRIRKLQEEYEGDLDFNDLSD